MTRRRRISHAMFLEHLEPRLLMSSTAVFRPAGVIIGTNPGTGPLDVPMQPPVIDNRMTLDMTADFVVIEPGRARLKVTFQPSASNVIPTGTLYVSGVIPGIWVGDQFAIAEVTGFETEFDVDFPAGLWFFASVGYSGDANYKEAGIVNVDLGSDDATIDATVSTVTPRFGEWVEVKAKLNISPDNKYLPYDLELFNVTTQRVEGYLQRGNNGEYLGSYVADHEGEVELQVRYRGPSVSPDGGFIRVYPSYVSYTRREIDWCDSNILTLNISAPVDGEATAPITAPLAFIVPPITYLSIEVPPLNYIPQSPNESFFKGAFASLSVVESNALPEQSYDSLDRSLEEDQSDEPITRQKLRSSKPKLAAIRVV